ncbi:MAG: hypothetical protein LH603_11530 [Pseudonocardia sp.]|nr:hypothetical protein [Pseudonocardia sp.]
MSTADVHAPAPPRISGPWLAATVAVAAAGPLAIAAVRAILPYDTTDEPAAIIADIQAAPTTTAAVIWLVFAALLTLPLGVAITARLAMAARPVLGTVAAVVAWAGFLSLFLAVGVDQLAPAAAEAGLTMEQTVALDGALTAQPTANLALMVFLIGHVLGAVLLGIALWGSIPRWAAAALIVSQPLHLVFAVIVPNHALDAAAWALTAVGFAAAALTSARRGPVTRGSTIEY